MLDLNGKLLEDIFDKSTLRLNLETLRHIYTGTHGKVG